jgi:hypothetical protein
MIFFFFFSDTELIVELNLSANQSDPIKRSAISALSNGLRPTSFCHTLSASTVPE